MSEPIKLLGRPADTVISTQQRQIAERQYEESRPSMSESFGAAYKLDTLAGVAYLQGLEGSGLKPDPNFVPDQPQLDSWMNEIRPEHYTDLLEATSKEHGEGIVRRLKAEYKANDDLGHSAMGGLGYRFFMSAADPGAWAAMMATEGLAAPFIFTAKATRLSKAIKGAIAAGTGNAALESYLYSQTSTKDPTDILYAAMIGGALGGAITPFIKNATPGAPPPVRPRNAVDRLHHEESVTAAHVANATEQPKVRLDDEPVAGEAPTAPAPKEVSPEEAAAKAEWDNLRAVAKAEKDAWNELEIHTKTIDERIDAVASLKDTQYTVKTLLAFVKELSDRTRAADKGHAPKVNLEKDVSDEVKEIFESSEGIGFKDAILERLKAGDIDAYRLEMRQSLKEINEAVKRQSQELRDLDTRTKMLKDRYAASKAATESFGDKSAGAAHVAGEESDRALLDSEDVFDTMEHVAQDTSKLGKMRIDIIGALLRSPNAFTRNMASRLSVDAVGRFDHSVAGKTAEEMSNHIREMAQLNFYKQYGHQFANWMAAQGLPWYARYQPSIRRMFNVEVSDAVRGIGQPSREAIAVGENMKKEMKALLHKAHAAKVKGFEDISKFDPETYFPRFIDKAAVRRLDAEFKTTGLEKLVAKGIRGAIPDMEEAMVLKLSRAYLTRLRKLEAGIESNFARMFSQDNAELVREILKEGLVESDIVEGIMYALKKANERKEGGRMSRAKSRLDLDEGVSIELKSEITGQVREVFLKELFQNDAENVFNLYARQMSGHIGLAQVGFRSRAEFSKWLDMVRSESQNLGHNAKGDIDRLEFMYKAISGSPLETDPAGWFSQTGKFLRDWNFLRVMNQVGVAQLAEIGNIVGQAGFRATLKHVPEMRRMLKRIKETGELEDELASELEAILPHGTDRLRNQVSTRYDSADFENNPVGGFFGAADQLHHFAKRVTADISLMAPINMVLHRMSLKAGLQRMIDDAHSVGRKLNDNRMAHLGISSEMRPRIEKLLREQTTLTDSTLFKGKKLRSLNVEAMLKADPEAANTLIEGLSRWSRTMIQQNEVGATSMWMHSTTGKILSQFRSFMMTAYGKQLLYGLRQADMETWASYTTSMFFGGAAYGLQTTVNSIGREDQDDFLEERLAPDAWALAAFQRAGFASLLPATMDTIWTHASGQDPIFAYGRTTGLASDAILGNPTVDLVNKISRSVSVPGQLASGEDFSQKNFRDMWGLVWYSNAFIARNIGSLIEGDLSK